MMTPLRRRAADFLAENPAWESWVDGHDQIWLRLFQLARRVIFQATDSLPDGDTTPSH